MEGGGTVSCVVVDFVYENGNCGLTLAGDNPVYVQDVKPGSPAFVAGVRNGDRIITVNGVDVQLKPHETVIKEIKSHSNVSLTLMRLDLDFRLPAHHSPGSSSPPPPPPPSMPYNRPLPPTPGQRSVSGSNVIDKNITPPQPANLEQQQQFVHQKENTLRRFLDHEKSTLAQLQVKLHDCKSRQKKQTLNTEIAKTEQRIQKLEEQLHRESRAWRSSEPSLVLPRRKESFSKDSDDDSPPPLPARNRSSYTPLPPPPPPPVPKHLDQSLMFPDQASTPPKVLIRGKSSSTSEMFHQRTKSNPDYLQALPESNSLIPVPCAGSGSKPQRSHSDFTAESRRQNVPSPSTGGSLINLNSSSGASTPPTSPPPLSAKKKSAILNFRRNTSENLAMLSALSPSLSSSGDPAEIMALDSEPEDEERRPIELFSKLTTVMKNNASLAAFLNYLMQYKDPSSLFFYLITDFYASQDGKDVKEMKKWVYEIYSTFLVPDAPLRLKNVEASDLHDIDQDILNNMEREEKLKGIFWKAKKAARNHLRDLLDDFKKAVLDGLLNIRIGVTEEELQAAENNKEKERDILERILLPNCKDRLTNLEEKEDKALALAYSLATVAVKQFNIRISDVKWAPYLAECPMFVSKDRRPTAYKFLPRKKQALTKGHKFQKRDYCEVTYCTHCLKLIWGIAPQGEHCQDCDLKVHKHCVSQVTEECVGTNKAEKKSKDKFPFFSDKGKRKGSTPGAAGDRLSRAHVDGFDNPALQLVEPPQGDRLSVVGVPTRRRPEPVSELDENSSHHEQLQHQQNRTDSPDNSRPSSTHAKRNSTSINRSESYSERVQKRKSTRESRKHSDPSLTGAKDSDADLHNATSLQNNTESSSNSSISTSRSIESPSNSMEGGSLAPSVNEPLPLQALFRASAGPGDDSDGETASAEWQRDLDPAILQRMSQQEIKRQDILNELFHTEKNHVRKLTILKETFYDRLRQYGQASDVVDNLFTNLEEMLEIHSGFYEQMKRCRGDNPVIEEVGDLLLSMFDGEAGPNFARAAATFCRSQSASNQAFKVRRLRDQELDRLVRESESDRRCQRLKLNDLIVSEMQRLTKYPLLLENLLKLKISHPTELDKVERALIRSKDIVNHVNEETNNYQRIHEILKRIDRVAFDKGAADDEICSHFKNLDWFTFRVIHEGCVTWRQPHSSKAVDVQLLLTSDYLIFLQKDGEKLVLKFHSCVAMGKEDKVQVSPVIRLKDLILRHEAGGKNILLILVTHPKFSYMYKIQAPGDTEEREWFKAINDAKTAYLERSKQTENLCLSGDVPDSLHDNREETEAAAVTEEAVPEREGASGGGSTSLGAGSTDAPQDDEGRKKHHAQASTSGKRFQRGVVLTLVEGPRLIEPSEVVISQGPASVFFAEPVITPLERLRKKDLEIKKKLEEKEAIVADILRVPKEEFAHISDIAEHGDGEKDARELVLILMNVAKRLSELLNDSLRVSEEDTVQPPNKPLGVPYAQVKDISDALNQHLPPLVNKIDESEMERSRLRAEAGQSREQLHRLHLQSTSRKHVEREYEEIPPIAGPPPEEPVPPPYSEKPEPPEVSSSPDTSKAEEEDVSGLEDDNEEDEKVS